MVTLPVAILFCAFIALVSAVVEMALNHDRVALLLAAICAVLLAVALVIPIP